MHRCKCVVQDLRKSVKAESKKDKETRTEYSIEAIIEALLYASGLISSGTHGLAIGEIEAWLGQSVGRIGLTRQLGM
jgi:hypothetical protein